MAVKAVALPHEMYWEGATTFGLYVQAIHLNATNDSTTIGMTGLSPDITELAFEQAIKDAVKAEFGLGTFDTVRLIGATL